MIYELLRKNRTIRRFKQNEAPSEAILRSFVESARLTASAANLQRLRYFLITDESDKIYPMISLGGYLPKEQKPTAAEKPTAYIAVMAPEGAADPNIFIDIGIVAEAITLAAAEAGVGSCMIRSFSKRELNSFIAKEGYFPELLIAFGYAAESAKIIDAGSDGDIKYYKDESGVNVVPKRTVDELII